MSDAASHAALASETKLREALAAALARNVSLIADYGVLEAKLKAAEHERDYQAAECALLRGNRVWLLQALARIVAHPTLTRRLLASDVMQAQIIGEMVDMARAAIDYYGGHVPPGQAYPTADAYEAVCRAHWAFRDARTRELAYIDDRLRQLQVEQRHEVTAVAADLLWDLRQWLGNRCKANVVREAVAKAAAHAVIKQPPHRGIAREGDALCTDTDCWCYRP